MSSPDRDAARDGREAESGAASAAPSHPKRIGPYRIYQVIGEGGMGVVYDGEQTTPVRRRVAVKMMKVGMDTHEVVARFAAERQALAVMDHPNIARVLDAGASDTGRPYFVMERVEGVPLTAYSDTNRLSTRQRLELFIPVCQAVQHAHQKGVIHRDLKPSNVLVGDQDGRPVPKIIDFGIAKAVGQRLTDQTLVTRFGQAMGTPAYMSPEQAEMSGLDVDTKTDIYSLGVMLYELLVGRLPIDPAAVGLPAFIAGLVGRVTDPPTPSARLGSLGDEQRSVARLRKTDPKGLRRQLRGDLDWIVMKAMEKDRLRRYETANALAMDLRRYLESAPVAARPPSTLYLMGRFVRRHRLAVSASAALALLLIGSVTALSLQSARIVEERDKAVEVAAFLEDLLTAPDPFATERRDTLRLRDFLTQASGQVRSGLTARPAVRAQMLHVLGRVHRNFGDYEPARTMLEEALAIRQEMHGVAHEEVLETGSQLAFLLWDMGAYDDAEQRFRQILEPLRERRDTTRLATVLQGLGNVLQARGDYDGAEPAYREALALLEGQLGPDHKSVADAQANLGTILVRRANFHGADSLFRSALAVRRRLLGAEHPLISSSLNNLAYVLAELGRLDEAEAHHREALAIARKNFGASHPQVARSLSNLGTVLQDKGNLDEAEELLRQSLAMRRELYGPEHLNVGVVLSHLATVLRRQGRRVDAEQMYREAIDVFHASVGPEHPRVAGARAGLAQLHHDNDDHAAAVRSYQIALDIRNVKLGSDHPLAASVLSDLGRCLTELGRYDEAERNLLQSLRAFEPRREALASQWDTVRARLAQLYTAWSRPDQAARYQAPPPAK